MRVPIPHTFLWYMLQMPLSRSGKCDSRDLMEFKVTECDSKISCTASCLSEIDLRVHGRKRKKHGKSVDEGMQRIMTVQSQSPTKQTWHPVSWNVLTKMSCFSKRCYTNDYRFAANFFFFLMISSNVWDGSDCSVIYMQLNLFSLSFFSN